ncbi:hypothetical protein GEM_3624 [Burkholderia cepacia GG4]|uniref:Uncharacterized protein n=1 Tax=Burkholderia cepacia GG4 TaxID=1009846 RepID=A0A9W3K498_BURCE|nr:hypothetical protein GEM_3624 [Burkholderia cepacia GG4]
MCALPPANRLLRPVRRPAVPCGSRFESRGSRYRGADAAGIDTPPGVRTAQTRNAIDSSVKIPTGSLVDRQRERTLQHASSTFTFVIQLEDIQCRQPSRSMRGSRWPRAGSDDRDTRQKHFPNRHRPQFSLLKLARAALDLPLKTRCSATFLRISRGWFVPGRQMAHPFIRRQDACMKRKRVQRAAARSDALMAYVFGVAGTLLARDPIPVRGR